MSDVEVVITTDPRQKPTTFRGRVGTYFVLTKPRIIELLLVTTVPAMFVAASGWPGTALVLSTLIGGALSAAGANTINQVIDIDIDRLMKRTVGRPLPAGKITARAALIFGIALGVLGFGVLAWSSNLLAAWLSTAGLLFYVFVYSMVLKRSTVQNIVIGGAAGAVPALVGWAAVTDGLAVAPWVMFAIVFFWTPPHFWALAIRYKDDYSAAAVPMLPSVVGAERAMGHIAAYSVVMVGAALSLWVTGAVGWIYLVASTAAGMWMLGLLRRLQRDANSAMSFFSASNVYLSVVFLAMIIDTLILT
ncbi:MAG: protoheme IX farnesyltransferase [Acidobacteria bacterium]|nr:protoheme IX farnesyltransferase [Acidobacteriota bacterium]